MNILRIIGIFCLLYASMAQADPTAFGYGLGGVAAGGGVMVGDAIWEPFGKTHPKTLWRSYQPSPENRHVMKHISPELIDAGKIARDLHQAETKGYIIVTSSGYDSNERTIKHTSQLTTQSDYYKYMRQAMGLENGGKGGSLIRVEFAADKVWKRKRWIRRGGWTSVFLGTGLMAYGMIVPEQHSIFCHNDYEIKTNVSNLVSPPTWGEGKNLPPR